MCPIRIEIIYGRGKFVGDFNMDNIICANLVQIILPILKSPTNLPLLEMPTPVKNVGHFVFFFKFLTKWGFLQDQI
jgi:hypothetical protein